MGHRGWTRRQVVTGAALAAAGVAGGLGRNFSALASITVGSDTQEKGGDVLVLLFLRGGADGLNIVVPYADEDYYRLRPTLALPRPNDRTAPATARALDLDGFFGLHPSLAPLLPLYQRGQLAAIHAVGSGDHTRSHFEAMATMERGLAQETGAASGWLARHLASTARDIESPLRAVAFADTMPDSLRGATNATALASLTDFRLTVLNRLPTGTDGKTHQTPSQRADAIANTLRGLYGEATPVSQPVEKGKERTAHTVSDAVQSAGRETLAALDAIQRLDPVNYRPAPGAIYPKNEIGNGFRQAACLIKGEVGLEIACLDMGGWDTHVAQGRETGFQPARLSDLGRALAAFATDLGPLLARVTTVVMTEFGRRAYENTGLGTDHGRASCMLLLGGGVSGGKVTARWPGLQTAQLEDGNDLRVTTDYRDILAEIVALRLKNPQIDEVFPAYTPHFRNVVRPA